MPWITTATGRCMSLDLPHPRDVMPLDIAWHLAQINRFTGAARRPYSVAEHSLLVSEIAEREMGLDVHGQFAALLHDAHEAYTNDLSSPAKQTIGQPWHQFEQVLETAVRQAMATIASSAVHRDAIKRADLMALATERRDLLNREKAGRLPWPVLEGIEPVTWVDLAAPEREAMTWADWRDRFIDRLHELDFARNDAVFGAPVRA